MRDIVDEIELQIRSPEFIEPELLRDPVAEYVEACIECNQRLRRIQGLLRRGHKSEAIQLAEQEPPVLELVEMLCFEALPKLMEVLDELGMQRPPALLLDVVEELQAAYAELQPYEHLLNSHRLLALARAPLKYRLRVARALAEADPTNVHLLKDIEDYERERLKEIEQAAKQARDRCDRATLEEALDELELPTWQIPVPVSLLTAVRGYCESTIATTARRELAGNVDQLEQLHAEFDIDGAQRLLEQSEQLVQEAALGNSEELAVRIGAIRRWIGEQAQMRAEEAYWKSACDALRRMLDADATRSQLERAFGQVHLYSLPAPEDLAERYRRRIDLFDKRDRRRFILIFSASAAVLLVTLSSAVLFVRQRVYQRNLADTITSLKKVLDAEDYQSAERLVQTLETNLRAHPEVRQLEESARQLRASDENRRERIAPLYGLLADVKDSYSMSAQQRAALEELRRLVRSDEERQRLQQIETRAAAGDRAVHTARMEKFAEDAKNLQARIDAVEKGGQSNSGETLNELKAEAQKLLARGRNEGVSDTLQMAARAILARLDGIEMRQAQREKEMELLERIRRAVEGGSLSAFCQALEAYGAAFPSTPHANAVVSTLESRAKWQEVVAWQDWLSDPSLRTSDTMSSSTAASLLEKGDAMLAVGVATPVGKDYQDRIKPWLESIRGRELSPGRTLQDELRREWEYPWIRSAWVAVVADRPHYLNAPLELSPGSSSAKGSYFTAPILPDGAPKSRTFSANLVTQTEESPQMRLYGRIRPILGKAAQQPWEDTVLEMLAEMTRPPSERSAEFDPILKTRLLKVTVNAGTRGSAHLKAVLKPLVDALDLNDNSVVALNWIDPANVDDDTIKEARQTCRQVLAQLPPLDGTSAALTRERKALEAVLRREYRWIGWIGVKGSEPQVEIVAQIPAQSKRVPLVVVSKDGGTCEGIGYLQGGRPVELKAAVALPGFGTPVFAEIDRWQQSE